jgi:hypothetical protein
MMLPMLPIRFSLGTCLDQIDACPYKITHACAKAYNSMACGSHRLYVFLVSFRYRKIGALFSVGCSGLGSKAWLGHILLLAVGLLAAATVPICKVLGK